VATETPDSLLTALPGERRPAIWPWLVMPLIALTAFYCLDRLAREAREREDFAPAGGAVIRIDARHSVRNAARSSDVTAQTEADAPTDSAGDSPEGSPAGTTAQTTPQTVQ